MSKEIIRSVIDRVLWTAGATEWNRDLLADAISEALAAAPQVVVDKRALFSDWLVTIPLPVQENIKASMERGESYTYKAFCAAVELAANHPGSTKIEGATFICDGAANPVSYSGPNGKMAIDLRGWTCYAPGAAPVQAQEPVRKTINPMGEDGDQWYFDCDGHYIDVKKDASGKYSIFFRDRSNGAEAWLDQADTAPVQPAAVPDGALPGLPRAEVATDMHMDGKGVAAFTDAQMRAYGHACHALGRGAAVREYVESGTFAAPAAQGDAETLQKVRDAVERFKVEWMKVPYFADRVNKATREQIGTATSIVVNIPCIIDAAIAAKAAS